MKITTHAYAILGIVTILTAVGVSAPVMKFAPPTPTPSMIVANTAANPVPTMSMGGTVAVSTLPAVTLSGTPNVNVSNTPTVNIASGQNVGITGTPSVNIANTPDVNISTSPDAPVHVRPASESNSNHINSTHLLTISAGNVSLSDTIYTVPQGKVLVVKDITFKSVLGGNQVLLMFFLQGIRDGYLLQAYVPVLQVTKDPTYNNTWSLGQAIGCSYIFEEGDIVARAQRSDDAGYGGVDVTISGYLEDAN